MTARARPFTPRLLPVAEAAAMLGLPERGLREAAERHGHLVRVGRAVRIMESELGELLDKCRSQPKAQDCSSDAAQDARPSGSSKTRANPNAAQAQQIAERLKSSSRNTSQPGTAAVVPLGQRK